MRAVVETTIPGNTQPNPACKVLLQAIAGALEGGQSTPCLG